LDLNYLIFEKNCTSKLVHSNYGFFNNPFRQTIVKPIPYPFRVNPLPGGERARVRGEFDTLEKNDDQKNLDYSNRLLR
jgi:hypothetical protein